MHPSARKPVAAILVDRPVADAARWKRLLEVLLDASIKRAIFCGNGVLAELQRDFGERFGRLELRYTDCEHPDDHRESLVLIKDQLDTDPVLVVGNAHFAEVDLIDMLAFHRWSDAEATMLLHDVCDTSRESRVVLNELAEVIGFASPAAAPRGAIDGQIYLLSQSVLDALCREKHSREAELLPHWIGHGLFGYRVPGPLVETSTAA
ncbi:MAG: hypothetical protein H6707_13950 [Deltaproteobacteria bacterium]|nr:hypothetical protein [Deltaproteobacteria bacterium]